MATPLLISKKCFQVQNTCPFDYISVLLVIAYTDKDKYKNYIYKRTNNLLQFCNKLATEPILKSTYKFHLFLLQTIFPEDTRIIDIKIISTRCSINYKATNFFKNSPSTEEN